MRLTFSLLFLAVLAFEADAQTVATDSISHEQVLIGPVQRSAFQDSSWYRTNYALYTPTTELISKIDSLSSGDSVSVVFGSWCSDSHMWVPMFLSIADSTALAHKIGFIGVPRSKGWREQLTSGLNIEKVPTFVFYHDGKEIGRIVEAPSGDIGDNVVEILSGSGVTSRGGK